MSLLADSQDESAALAVDNQHQQFKSESNLGNDASTINSSTENDEDQATVELVKDEDEERDSQESSLKDSQSSALPAASVMNDQMTSDRRDGSVPMPYPLIHTSPIIPVVFPAMRAIKLKDQLRKGKWTVSAYP